MTERADIERTVRALWRARLANDLDTMMTLVADDAEYSMNARGTGVQAFAAPTSGKPGVKELLGGLLDTWHFDNWREVSLLVDGDQAFLRWTATAKCVPTNKSADFDVFDVFALRDGKIVKMHESTDTAMLMSLAAG